MGDTFTYIQLCVGGYLLWCAMSGTGKLYEAPKLKCPRKQYKRVMSILAAITAVFMILDPILMLTKVTGPGSTLTWVLWGLGLSGIIAMAAYSKKMVIKGASNSGGQTQSGSAASSDPLRAAFEFDEEENSSHPNGEN